MSKIKKFNYYDIKPILPDHKVIGHIERIEFSNIKPVDKGDVESLVFISTDKFDVDYIISTTKAKVILISDLIILGPHKYEEIDFIIVKNPKLTFAKIANKLFTPQVNHAKHPTAIIHEDAEIDKNVFIGAHCVIGKGFIGSGTVIHPNVTIYDNFYIGKNVIIHSGSVIGAEGFGYIRDEDGTAIQFPHVGGVIIEDYVEIGANTCIDRGALSNTIIREGVKIDNLVHVAHNVEVGSHTFLIANTMIGGSTKIGNRAYIAPSVSIRDHTTVGNDSFVGMAASVLKSIPDNETWTGIPAQPLERVKKLNKRLNDLIDIPSQ